MSNILEEYLVKIGAEVDRNAFNGANQAVLELTRTLQNLGSVLKIGAIAGLFAKITESVVSNIKAVADLDMQYQKLANSMWVTKGTAKDLKIAMETMGASEQDIAWIPELREQFFRLREEMHALATPEDADAQLSWIRQIGYDVQSLQVKLKMLREWIVYYLIKYLKPYIEELQKFIQWLNEKLGNNMPAIAKKIASALSSIVSMVVSLGRFLKNIYDLVSGFGDHIPSTLKKVVAAFAIAGAAIMMSPFGAAMAAIGAAMLMLEDYYYYTQGWKSSKTFAPLWGWLENDNNPIKNALNQIKEAIEAIIDRIVKFLQEVFTEDLRNDLVKTAQKIAEAVWNVAGGIANIIKKMLGGSPSIDRFWDHFAKGVKDAIKSSNQLARIIFSLFNALGLAMQGKFKEAGMELKSAAIAAGGFVFGGNKNVASGIGSGLASLFRGNGNSVDRAAALTAEQPDDLLGNPNGCTAFVKAALGADDEFMQEMGENLWTPDWLKAASTSGRFVPGTDGMQAGDIVVLDTDGAGDGSHVVLYDGQGGYYGNSTNSINKWGTRGKPVHGSMSDWDGQIMGYIRTGKMLRSDGGSEGSGSGASFGSSEGSSGYNFNPQSYAGTGFPSYTPTTAAMGLAGGTSYNTSSSSYGNIIININGAQSPQDTAAAVRDVFANPNGVLGANKARTGGVL